MTNVSAKEVAAQRLSDMFKTPEVPIRLVRRSINSQDLAKIESFRTRFAREKATVDAQLRAGIRAQLEITQVSYCRELFNR